MAKDISHLFAKLFRYLFFSFVFLSCPTFHHQIALNEFPHFLLELEDIPVAVSFDAEFTSIEVGNFFYLPGDFVDVHDHKL